MSFLAGLFLGILVTFFFTVYEMDKMFRENVQNARTLKELKEKYKGGK